MAVPKMRGSLFVAALAVPRTRGSLFVQVLAFSKKRSWLCVAGLALAFCAIGTSTQADEIRLKDGKKLYGVIVAYEDNMFKVKTDYGYVLVEKDKIASIVPSTPASEAPKTDKTPVAKKDPATGAEPKAEPAVASSAEGTTSATNASAKSAEPAAAGKREKTGPKITNAAVKPEVPAATKTNGVAPTLTAPSWQLNEEARKKLPNAIVALGTYNQSTLMVIGEEQSKAALDMAAATVEKRLSEIYDNYRRISQRKTVVGGLPAVEYHYRGMADGHDWSGTLVVISRGTDVFTVLGMTYADNDLIQIQENVINRSIASLDFNVR